MRNLSLLFIELVFSRGHHERVDPNCPDYDLNTVCHIRCLEETYKCIMSCDSDSDCVYQCFRAEVPCLESCPCNLDCPNGCDGCENSICECSDVTENADWNKCLDVNGMSLARCIYNCEDNGDCESDCVAQFKGRTANCPCEENCPGGCPCDDYECEDITPTVTSTSSVATTTMEPIAKDAVLLLRTYNSNNVPMVIEYNGEVDDDTNFTFEDNTGVYYSCAASLNDEMWVLGGYKKERQMSKIQDCRLTVVGELPFDYHSGGCNTFSFGIMLCFSESAQQECHSFNGETFKAEPSSKFPHQYVLALGSYKNSPFVTGHNSNTNGLRTEMFDFEAKKWSQLADYPFSNGNQISRYATAQTDESVLIIGGYTDGSPRRISTIAEYKDGNWKNIGNLAQARRGHSAITSVSVTIVVGGYEKDGSSMITELWELNSLESRIIDPTLKNGDYYAPGMFLVDIGFCSKH